MPFLYGSSGIQYEGTKTSELWKQNERLSELCNNVVNIMKMTSKLELEETIEEGFQAKIQKTKLYWKALKKESILEGTTTCSRKRIVIYRMKEKK